MATYMTSHDPFRFATSQTPGTIQSLPSPPHDLTHGFNGLILGYAIVLVGWVGVAAFILDRRLRRDIAEAKTA